MSIELQRWRCPDCSTLIDVWVEDGVSTSSVRCPDCLAYDDEDGNHVPAPLCIYDEEATDLWD